MIGSSLVKRAASALDVNASGWLGWSSPATDYKARVGWTTHGALQMVPERGAQRWATYRMVYVSNPWVWAAVNSLADGLGRMPLGVYKMDADGYPVRVRHDMRTPGRNSALADLDALLHHGFQGQQSGQRMSRQSMVRGTLVDRLIYGNALWLILRDGMGNPTGLRRIRWRDVLRVEPDMDGWPLQYWWRPWNGYYYGPIQYTPVSDVVHFGFGSDPEGIYGISPLESCRSTLALHDALVRHLIGFFSNSARPSGFLEIDPNLNKDRAAEIRELLDGLYASPENAGKIFAAAGKWNEMGKAPDQSSIISLIEASRHEILAAYTVPPPVVGITKDANYSNVKEMREQFGRDSLGPRAEDFVADLEAQLVPQRAGWSGATIEFDLMSLLLPDVEALATVTKDLASTWDVDELRTKLWRLPPKRMKGITDTPWSMARTFPMGRFDEFAEAAAKAAGISSGQSSSGEPQSAATEPPDDAPDGSERPAPAKTPEPGE